MDEKDKQSVEMRKLQEQSANMIAGGMHKEIAKWHKAIYDAYTQVGFTPGEALDLIKASINHRGL